MFRLKEKEADDRPLFDLFSVSACEVSGLSGINTKPGKGILDRTGAIPYRALSANCLRDRKIFYLLNPNRKGECRRRKRRMVDALGRLPYLRKRHENCV
jgi:hypothetical protein